MVRNWQLVPPNLGNEVDDLNNTKFKMISLLSFLDGAANCVGDNDDDDNSENTNVSSIILFIATLNSNSDTELQ